MKCNRYSSIQSGIIIESDETNKSTTFYTLEKTGVNTTKLTLDYYVSKYIFNQITFQVLHRNNIKDAFNRSLQNLVQLVKEIKLREDKIE